MGPAVIIVGLVFVGLWLSGRLTADPMMSAGQNLPPPDPIPSMPGNSLLSPAMDGNHSALLQSANGLRLTTNMTDVLSAAASFTVPGRGTAELPPLATPANGLTLGGWGKTPSLPSSQTGGGLRAVPPTGATPWTKV
jgi:hypothetical protein